MRVSRRLFFALLLALSPCIQAETADDALIRLIETDDSLCLAHGGNMVSLQLTDAAAGAVEVWVDRWFMQVQTADHTRHILTPDAPEKELGCSHSIAGPQHWTIYSIKRLPVAGAPLSKE